MTFIKFENTEVFNIKGALRRMSNPMNSWDKEDITRCYLQNEKACECCKLDCVKMNDGLQFAVGEKDLNLCLRLIKAGPEHRKFLQQIFVCVDITAPRYWWQEMDTYSVGITKNSCSTMHKLTSRPLTITDFEIPGNIVKLINENSNISNNSVAKSWVDIINTCNDLILKYNDSKDLNYLIHLKSMLPEGLLQKRTITLNYENLLNIYKQRENHRLPHCNKDFMNWVLTLPYMVKIYRMNRNIK